MKGARIEVIYRNSKHFLQSAFTPRVILKEILVENKRNLFLYHSDY